MTPKRIQRKRTKGWKMPENAVYVGRPTIWGNPFTANDKEWDGEVIDNKTLVLLYEIYLAETFGFKKNHRRTKNERKLLIEFLGPLRGKDLACWCKEGEPCHADVLLRLVNQ